MFFEFLNIYFFGKNFVSGGHKSYMKLINGGFEQLGIKFRLFLTCMAAKKWEFVYFEVLKIPFKQ